MSVELNGARVLLTGASGGIGHAIARALHGRGAHLMITGRKQDALDSLAAELGRDRVEALPADLADRDAVSTLIERAGRVDVLVANAGLPASGKLTGFTPEQIDRAIEVNLRAPIQLTRALVPAMSERGSGHIVLVSSMAGKVSNARSSIYSATKFGLRAFGFAMHEELARDGVGVTTVFPGFIRDAGMFAESGVKLPPGVGTKTPEQVAAAVLDGIENNKVEIDVAPVAMRVGARLAGAAPVLVGGLQRRLGSQKVGRALEEGQADKR